MKQEKLEETMNEATYIYREYVSPTCLDDVL